MEKGVQNVLVITAGLSCILGYRR